MALVAVVGRPNVGKSTLINRILGKRETIVEETPGVTRDRKYLAADWNGRPFTLIDTGGLIFGDEDGFADRIREQALFAVRQADAVICIVDGRDGLIGPDEDIAEVLRGSDKPVFLAVNKWDNPMMALDTASFYKLGLGDPMLVSAIHGLGVGELLDAVVKVLPEEEKAQKEEHLTVAIVGRPNVGKSSIFNRLIGEERVIVSEIAGTTRDSIDSLLIRDENRYLFLDTAGLRRKSLRKTALEFYSSVRVFEAIDRADLILLILDAKDGVTDQDKKIAAHVESRGRALIVLANKWDLIEGDRADDLIADIGDDLRFVPYAPLLCVSAITGRGLDRIFPALEKVAGEYRTRIPTHVLNEFVDEFRSSFEAAAGKRSFRILYATQASVKPPTIVFFTTSGKKDKRVTSNYRRYLENRVRERFSFEGVPIKIRVKVKSRNTLK